MRRLERERKYGSERLKEGVGRRRKRKKKKEDERTRARRRREAWEREQVTTWVVL